MMKIIKEYWWAVGLGIILLLLFWPKKTTEKQVTNKQEDQSLPIELPKIQSVNWLVVNNIELPKINKLKIQKQIVDAERETKINELLGIKNGNGYIDKINNVVGYTEDITSPQQLPMENKWDIDVLKNKLKKITEEVNGISDLDILWTRIKYQKILYPRWMESTQDEAQSVEIRGDYIINNVRTTTYFGESIKGTFNREGHLLNLVISLRPEILPNEGKEELININEANKSPINFYGAVDNAGIEKIGQVNITQAEIVQVYSNKDNFIKPYYLLSGNTYSENKPEKVLLLLKAEK